MFERLFETPLLLFGLLLLVPIIILYLLKPKPKEVRLPTLMFIKNIERNRRFASLFDRLIKDPILLTQLLVIILLAVALAKPFISSDAEGGVESAIAIVVDASASMQAKDMRPDRFSSALAEADEILERANRKSSVSIILAENIPITLLDKGSVEQARLVLGKLKAADTSSNIGDSIILAKDMIVGESKSKVIHVLSDFSDNEGMDPSLAKKIAELNDIKVKFVKFGSSGRNVGVIDFSAWRSSKNPRKLMVTVTIRNYDPEEHTVQFKIQSNRELLDTQERTMKAYSDLFYQGEYSIPDESQLVRVELTRGDDLAVDDSAYAVVEGIRTLKTLLISSEGMDSYLRLALQSLPNNVLDVAEVPVIPEFGKYDLIILGSVSNVNIPPGTLRDISLFTRGGGSFIMVPYDFTAQIGESVFYEMSPVVFEDIVSGTGLIYSDIPYHEIVGREGKEEIGFSGVTALRYFRAAAKNNSITVVSTGKYPLISYQEYGRGRVLYLGINPDERWSNFRMSSEFPILLYKIMLFLTGDDSFGIISSYNSGEYLSLEMNATLTTPAGEDIESTVFFLDDAGVYDIAAGNFTKTFSVNLLNEMESNISATEFREYEKVVGLDIASEKTRRYFYSILIAFALFILFAETFLYRRRGLL
ncbi:MAG: VWA domain-containing protein [Candidatus Altiarchaeota archaeon]